MGADDTPADNHDEPDFWLPGVTEEMKEAWKKNYAKAEMASTDAVHAQLDLFVNMTTDQLLVLRRVLNTMNDTTGLAQWHSGLCAGLLQSRGICSAHSVNHFDDELTKITGGPS